MVTLVIKIYVLLQEYTLRSSDWRKESNQTQLLLGTIMPCKEVVSSTILLDGLGKTVLKLADVDVNIFKGHFTRAASTSKAIVSGLSLCEILERGSWSSVSTWQRFYKKDIIPTTVANFQQIFMKHKKLTIQELSL